MGAFAGVPYVGMRPFDRDESAIFTGRDRDAAILTDKILAARQTVLYAESGLGKSSLLRVLVVPGLEHGDAVALYFDDWGHAEPLAALTSALVARAALLKIPDAGLGRPSLSELVRLIAASTGRAVVLVLDQFEECIRRPDHEVKPLRQELAKIVHTPSIDAAVVLSLREEFLASLEEFRRAIPDLLGSVYRLEALTRDQLMTAICEPPKVCGGSCDIDLAKRLVDDIERFARERDARDTGHDPRSERAAGHALPIVQLVCSELWRASSAGRLDVALYERQGGTEQIVKSYVHRVMPKGARASLFTARLMRFLAPPSGKTSYSASDLALMAHLDETKVGFELDRLKGAGILQTRPFRKVTRYELQHDAYIGVIGPWRDRIIARNHARKRVFVGLAAGLILALTGMGALSLNARARMAKAEAELANSQREQDRRDMENERQRTRADADVRKREAELRDQQNARMKEWLEGGFMTDRAPTDPDKRDGVFSARFGFLVASHLWPESGEPRLEELRHKLETFASNLPKGYANRTDAAATRPDQTSPVRIAYGPDLQLDEVAFATEWQELSTFVTSSWGVPVPGRVRLEQALDVPKGHLRLTISNTTSPNTPPLKNAPELVLLPDYGRGGLMLGKPTSPPEAVQFFQQFPREWKEFSPRERLSWYRVPAWSFPVWKMTMSAVRPASGAYALHTLQYLLDHPAPLLTDEALDAMLERVSTTYEHTVNEARRARGDRLGTDLAILMGTYQHSLQILPEILDLLAERPTADSAAAAADVESVLFKGDWSNLRQRGSEGLHGRFTSRMSTPSVCSSNELSGNAPQKPYCDAAKDLPLPEPLLRAYVSDDLLPAWWPNGKASQQLTDGLTAVRERVYARHGIRLPGVRFRLGDSSRSAVRIELMGERPEPGKTKSVSLRGPDDLDSFFALLERNAEEVAPFWVTAESVDTIVDALPPNTRDWLLANYSVTDLKVLLREVVDSGAFGGARYAQWLLPSLVFWSVVRDESEKADVLALSDDLITLQSRSRSPGGGATQPDIVQGTVALAEDDVMEALRRFKLAAAANRPAAIREFEVEWPRHLVTVWTSGFESAHPTLPTVSLDEYDRSDIRDLSGQQSAAPTAAAAKLRLYPLADHDAAGLKSAQAANTLRVAASTLAGTSALPAAYERWLGQQVLESYDASRDTPAVLRDGSALLKSAVRRLPPANARQVLLDLLKKATTEGPNAWTWSLADELVSVRPATVENNLGIELAWSLAQEERPERLTRAITLADSYDALVRSSQLSAERRRVYADTVRYVRGVALYGLARENQAGWNDALEPLQQLLQSADESLRKSAHEFLARLEHGRGRPTEADGYVAAARIEWPDDFTSQAQALWSDLRQGRRAAAATLVAGARDRARRQPTPGADDERLYWSYLAATAGAVIGSDGWDSDMQLFLGGTHRYRDLNLMIYRGLATGVGITQAQSLIDERWAKVRTGKDSWSARIKEGDATAWRELLLGRFVGDEDAIRLLRPLDDEVAFSQSDLRYLPATRSGLRTESAFYDAMRARHAADLTRYRARLEEVLTIGYDAYIEYSLAAFLSRTEP